MLNYLHNLRGAVQEFIRKIEGQGEKTILIQIGIGIGTLLIMFLLTRWQISKSEESFTKLISETKTSLEGVANHIKLETSRQIEANKQLHERVRMNSIKALIYEIDFNCDLIKDITRGERRKKLIDTRSDVICAQRFLTITLEKVISSNYVYDLDLIKDLQKIHEIFSYMNKVLDINIHQIARPTQVNNMLRVYKTIEEKQQVINNIKSELDRYLTRTENRLE